MQLKGQGVGVRLGAHSRMLRPPGILYARLIAVHDPTAGLFAQPGPGRIIRRHAADRVMAHHHRRGHRPVIRAGRRGLVSPRRELGRDDGHSIGRRRRDTFPARILLRVQQPIALLGGQPDAEVAPPARRLVVTSDAGEGARKLLAFHGAAKEPAEGGLGREHVHRLLVRQHRPTGRRSPVQL